MKEVLYNKGGHVAHIAIRINYEDSFDAFGVAASIAKEHDGLVQALYQDSKWGQRTRILGVERAGLVLEFGTLDERVEDALKADRLRKAIEEYLRAEPRKAGHAEAHRKLADVIKETS